MEPQEGCGLALPNGARPVGRSPQPTLTQISRGWEARRLAVEGTAGFCPQLLGCNYTPA